MLLLHLLPVALLRIITIRLARIHHERIAVEERRRKLVLPRAPPVGFISVQDFPKNCAGGKALLDVLQKASAPYRPSLVQRIRESAYSCFTSKCG